MDKSLKASRNGAKRRPNFPAEFKRKLVEESFVPGASVALIARRNDINANLLFKWRRQHFKDANSEALSPRNAVSVADAEFSTLLPVSVVDEAPQQVPAATDVGASGEDICEVEFDHARLRIRGEVSPATLRLLIREWVTQT